jgi:hypothetical protein
MQPSFNTSALDLLSPTIEEFVKRVVCGLEKEANENAGIVEVSAWIYNYTFTVIGALALGTDFNGLENREPHEYVTYAFKYLKGADIVSFQKSFLTGSTCFLRGSQNSPKNCHFLENSKSGWRSLSTIVSMLKLKIVRRRTTKLFSFF